MFAVAGAGPGVVLAAVLGVSPSSPSFPPLDLAAGVSRGVGGSLRRTLKRRRLPSDSQSSFLGADASPGAAAFSSFLARAVKMAASSAESNSVSWKDAAPCEPCGNLPDW